MSEEKKEMPVLVSNVVVDDVLVTLWSDCTLVVAVGVVNAELKVFEFQPDKRMYFQLTNNTSCDLYDWVTKEWDMRRLRQWLDVQYQVDLIISEKRGQG